MTDNIVNIKLLSKSNNEGFARVCVSAFAMQLDPTLEDLSEIKTAVSEAVTNCIVHAYKDRIGYINLKLQILDGNILKITVKDNGDGIDDINKAMEPCYTTGSDDRAGMGFTIMESFMDKLHVKSKVKTGTTVVMEKRIIKRK